MNIVRPAVAFVAVCIASSVASRLEAQGTFVVPSKATVSAPDAVWLDRAYQTYPFYGHSQAGLIARTQYLYDAADIPVAAANLTALSFRSPHVQSNAAGTYQTTILVSQGPNLPGGASAAFASNHGPNPTTVLSGSVNLPATSGGTWPMPWQAAIPFAQPVPFSKPAGGSLVVEFQTTVTNSRPWILEGYRIEGGIVRTEFSDVRCRHSGGSSQNGFSWNTETMVPGGSLLLALSSYPRNTPSLSNNALFLSPTGLGSIVAGMTTPFPLANLGVPSSPSCKWAIGLFGYGWPMAYNATYGQLLIQGLPIPNDPGLVGASVFVQNAAADTDPSTGATLIFPSAALELSIGSGIEIPATRVSGSGWSLPTSGTVKVSNAASLQLHY